MKHIEFLVEDSSGKAYLEQVLPNMLPNEITYKIHAYQGIGRLPKNLGSASDPSKRILLQQLPRLLRGYANAFASDPQGYRRYVVLICDLDNRNRTAFQKELDNIFAQTLPVDAGFAILAIEEIEAWMLGDKEAVILAYPKARIQELNSYVNDSICGTWEKLADAVHQGGHRALKKNGYAAVGASKHEWADRIGSRSKPLVNISPSFISFRARIQAIKNA